jgi:DNA polymerase-4
MDAFYASVEQHDNPELKGKPVIVGGRPDSRGVVAACSYEARTFGIHSAMPCSRAYHLCPQAIFIRPRLDRYREISGRIMAIFRQYTDKIEPLSLDEAFLDLTENKKGLSSATLLASDICKRILHETGLTASAGVSCNKFVAKIASDLNKPNGISVIKPEEILGFLATLPIGKFYGVGAVTEKKMRSLGINSGSDLRNWSLERLVEQFGKHGIFYYNIVRGRDNREVQSTRVRKSLGSEQTLSEDTQDLQQIRDILSRLATKIGGQLENKNTAGHTVTLKVRYSDFTTITRSLTNPAPFRNGSDIEAVLESLLARTEAGLRQVRLLGISLSNLVPADQHMTRQLPLPFPVSDQSS